MIEVGKISRKIVTRIQQQGPSLYGFTEEQMRAYFLKKDTLKRLIYFVTLTLGLLCLLIADIGLVAKGLHRLTISIWASTYFIIIGTAFLLLLTALILRIFLTIGPKVPTDREFDAWVATNARDYLKRALRETGQDLSEDEVDRMIYVHGFILPSTKNANRYRKQDLLEKKGRDHKQRHSINVFTYFLPAEHQLIVFIIHINAVNFNHRGVQVQEYFYTDIVAATTEEEQDTIKRGEEEHFYLTHSFALRICDGNRVSVTIHSKPVDHEQKLDIYEIPASHADEAIARLRLLLRNKKYGTPQSTISSTW